MWYIKTITSPEIDAINIEFDELNERLKEETLKEIKKLIVRHWNKTQGDRLWFDLFEYNKTTGLKTPILEECLSTISLVVDKHMSNIDFNDVENYLVTPSTFAIHHSSNEKILMLERIHNTGDRNDSK